MMPAFDCGSSVVPGVCQMEEGGGRRWCLWEEERWARWEGRKASRGMGREEVGAGANGRRLNVKGEGNKILWE